MVKKLLKNEHKMYNCIGVISKIGIFIIPAVLLIHSNSYSFPYGDLNIGIGGTINETYDDNLTFSKKDSKADLITDLGLSLNVNYEGKRRSLGFTTQINEEVYAKYTDIKNSSQILTCKLQNEFSKYDRMTLIYSFSHAQSPASFQEEFGVVRGKLNSYQNRVDLNYKRDISEDFNLTARYSKDYANEISSEGEITSSSLNRIGLTANYIYSTDTTFSLSYNLTKRKDNDASYSVNTGMRQYINKRLYFDGKGAVDVLTTFGVASNSIQGSLTDEIDSNNVASLSFIRREQSVSNRFDVYRNWQVIGQYGKQLSDRLGGSLRCSYGRGRFIKAGGGNQSMGVSSSISYDFNETLHGSLQYTYSTSDSTNEVQGYYKNTISLGLTASY
jgi:hypothetical protein